MGIKDRLYLYWMIQKMRLIQKTAEAMEYNLRWLLQSGVPSLDPIRGRICVNVLLNMKDVWLNVKRYMKVGETYSLVLI